MIIFTFLLVAFMLQTWVGFCTPQTPTGTSMCPSFTPQMGLQMVTAADVFYTFAALTAVFFTVKCCIYPNHKMHVFPKMKRGY